ncbi:MAG: hypothetical protein Q9183_004671 [Haloplaca sp. 2 TL-2023]
MFEDSKIRSLDVTLLSWTPDDLVFRELAFSILCLAAGGEYLSLVDDRRVLFPLWTDLYGTVAHGGGSASERELVTSVGAGFHMHGQDMGSAPSTSRYWFSGALICLVPRLKELDARKCAIADVIRYGREECGQTSFNAVLISIGDLVLLKSFPDGHVEHSGSLSLLSTTGSSAMDAENRYGKSWLDDFYEREMARRAEETQAAAEEPITQTTHVHSGSTEGSDNHEKEEIHSLSGANPEIADDVEENQMAAKEKGENQEEVEPEHWVAGYTFLQLVSFFNATVHDTLKPTDDSRRKMPTEITRMILGHVMDLETYHACTKVSRVFRNICHERPLLMNGIKLLKALPTANGTPGRELQLLAVDSRGLQFNIEICGENLAEEATLYRLVVGREWNRKSFCPDSIAIKGLDVPEPFSSNIFPRARTSISWPERYRSDGSNAWNEAREDADIVADGDIRTLCRFWDEALKTLFRDVAQARIRSSVIEEHTAKAWLMPPNTKQYSIDPEWYRCKKWERVLFLRIKRASKYWDCLWSDIVREAKELLASVDDDPRLERHKIIQRVGAADPAVVLVVGLEVRLFEWDAATSTLAETDPGRVYSVMDEEDRKSIEAVFSAAVERLSEMAV